VQLAALAGATVIAQTTSLTKADMIAQAGAHQVVVTQRGHDFSAEVRDRTHGRGVNCVIDTVGTPLFTPARKSLAKAGRWVLVGQLTGEFVPFNPAQLFLRNIAMLSATSTTRQGLADTMSLIARGAVKPVISGEFPLSDAALAHRALEAGSVSGRLILRPSP
jgi:NADPH:quinone reductase-like Zn-dependent oxidoreductase